MDLTLKLCERKKLQPAEIASYTIATSFLYIENWYLCEIIFIAEISQKASTVQCEQQRLKLDKVNESGETNYTQV